MLALPPPLLSSTGSRAPSGAPHGLEPVASPTPGITLRARPRPSTLRCAICHEPGRERLPACPGCQTVVHAECRGPRCPTLGCDGAQQACVRPRVVPRPPRRAFAHWVGRSWVLRVCCATLLGCLALVSWIQRCRAALDDGFGGTTSEVLNIRDGISFAPLAAGARDGELRVVGQTTNGFCVDGTVSNGFLTNLRVGVAPYDPSVHGPLR